MRAEEVQSDITRVLVTEEQIRAKLDELNATLEKGWDDLSEAAAAKLNAWLE